MGHIRASLLVGNPRFDLVGIVDKDPVAGRALGEMYGVSRYFTRLLAISSLVAKLLAISHVHNS
jgi:predicted dehydrogenase